MEQFDRKVIFIHSFPDAAPDAMERMGTELLQEAIARGEEIEGPTYVEFLERVKTKYIYEPKSDGKEKAEEFISFAIEVCQDFSIDTVISRGLYDVIVSMDIYFSHYEGDCKNAIEALISLSDEIDFTYTMKKPDCFCMGLTYNTHIRHYKR